jgi:hypothetical protein
MPIRILTGFVNVREATAQQGGTVRTGPKQGTVRIGFNPHELIEGDAPIADRGEVGPAARFNKVPGKMVALRQISILPPSDPSKSDFLRFTVGDEITRDNLTISWSGDGACFSEEISYLVFGEVPETIPVHRPPRRIPGPQVPSPRRRSKKGKKKGKR